MFDDGVVMPIFLCSFPLLYLTLHLEFFEVEQICLSFLMVHFVEIDFFAFVGFLFATSVWPFLHLLFSLVFIKISFSLIPCFSLLFSSFSVSVSFFSIPISSFLVYTGNVWSMYCSKSSRAVLKQASSCLILLELSSFCWSNFFQSAPEYLSFHQ